MGERRAFFEECYILSEFRTIWKKVDALVFGVVKYACVIILTALVVRRNEHLRVTMLDDKFGEKGVFITEILSTVCIVVFSLFLIYYGGGLTSKGASNNMAGINVPYSVMYVSMPVTGVLNLFAVIGEWLERGEKA